MITFGLEIIRFIVTTGLIPELSSQKFYPQYLYATAQLIY